MAQSLYRQASLVMNPYGAKDDLLPSIKPTDGSGDFTFSRDGAGASPATRVNASGLIEKGRENVLLQSNQFDTTWSLVNASVTGGQSGYDGSSDAWLLESTASGVSGSVRQFVSLSGVGTFSVYAKAGNVNFIAMYVASSGADFNLWADLSSGSIGTTASDIETTITSVGGGWYRITLTGLNPDQRVDIYPANADGSYVTGTGENIYIQDAQLEQGLVATDYIETTTAPVSAGLLGDMPRLDYSGGATCPSLLLEPSRVNSIDQSEYFGSWLKYSLGSGSLPVVTSNYITSPEGVDNASRVQLDAGGSLSTDRSRLYTQVSVTSGTDYTFTFYAKSNTGNTEYIKPRAASVNYNEIEITTEWKRFEVSFTANSTGSFDFGFECRGNHTENSADILVYGAQVELGSYPTSYIPTYGSASGRAADSCIKTGISSLIGQSEGVVFLDFIYKPVFDDANSQTTHRFSVSDGTYTNRITLYPNNSNGLGVLATGVVFTGTYSLTEGQRYKVALAYGTTSVVYINGVEAFGYVSGTPTGGYDRMQFADATNSLSRVFGSPVNQALLFDTRLTNAELAALTTL